jgi:aspartokinase
MRVLKFGGTSVANAERFLRVADILESNARQGQVATVLSAPAKITNHLVAMIEKTIGGQDALPISPTLNAFLPNFCRASPTPSRASRSRS